jgi:DNA polymerase III subunit delta
VKLSPVSFLVGPEPLQHRIHVEGIRKEIFPGGSGGLNDDTFDAKEKSLSDIFDFANTFPMMATRRLIILRNAGDPKEADENRWLAYLENPSPHTILIASADKIDKRKRLYKALEKHGSLLLLPEVKQKDIPSWIDRLTERRAVQISPQARLALANAVGTDLTLLQNEIDKLALYVHPETTITETAVEALVLKTTGGNVFEFTDQVAERRTFAALTTLDHLVDTGTPPLVLVSLLARHFRVLLKAHHHLHAHTNRTELPQALGVPPFVVSRYLDQAKLYAPASLRHAIGELRKLDHDLKSTGHPPKMLLERSLRAMVAQ